MVETPSAAGAISRGERLDVVFRWYGEGNVVFQWGLSGSTKATKDSCGARCWIGFDSLSDDITRINDLARRFDRRRHGTPRIENRVTPRPTRHRISNTQT